MIHKTLALRFSAILAVALLSGCGEKVVYNRPIAELNQKAQVLLAAGDAAGAVARLESARDLNPEETSTLFNLGVAYQSKGDLDKAIQTFQELLEKPGTDAAKINQSLGVLYEEKADSLLAKGDELKEKKGSLAELQQLNTQAVEGYQQAIEAYQKANPASGEAKAQLQNQVQALQKKIQELQAPQPV